MDLVRLSSRGFKFGEIWDDAVFDGVADDD